MKALWITEFDPAGVGGTHQRALRSAGIDLEISAHHGFDSLWRVADDGDISSDGPALLSEKALQADVLIFSVGIGNGFSGDWAARKTWDGVNVSEAPFRTTRGVDWTAVIQVRQKEGQRNVAYFHGSAYLKTNWEAYTRICRSLNLEMAVSSLEYWGHVITEGNPPLVYLPPAIPPAPASKRIRDDGEGLRVVFTPTNWELCGGDRFMEAVREAQVSRIVAMGLPHRTVLDLKRFGNVGFDHFRDGFSVNTLENASMGLFPIIVEWGSAPSDMPRLEGWRRYPELADGLKRLDALKPSELRALNDAALEWSSLFYDYAKKQLLDFYTRGSG